MVYGKKTMKPTVKQLRAILPLPAALQVYDVILAMRLEAWLDESLQPARNLHIGARRGTQTLEIAQSLPLVMEKSGDRRSRGATAQYDVETYYDTIPVMLVIRDMQKAGASSSLMAAIVRQQRCVMIRLTVGSEYSAAAARRTSGALTGSRVAGQLGRWPVERSMRMAMRDPTVRGWAMPNSGDLLFASYVDNLYGLADTPSQLAHNMNILEMHLLQDWRLRIKPGSSQMVVCRGTPDTARDFDGDDEAGPYWIVCGWHAYQSMNVLGHRISWGGSPHECISQASPSAWRRLWATTSSAAMRKLPMWCRLRVLNFSVLPVLTYRMPHWPWATTTATALDRLQRRMLSVVLQVRPYLYEEVNVFVRRRDRMAAKLQDEAGRRSAVYSTRLANWAAHVHRRPPAQSVRQLLARGDVSRTETRLRGPVQRRWDEGLAAVGARFAL